MKRVINGKRYDTGTAKCVASDSYSYPSDFHWWNEELYRKNTGEFFLFGEGGAMSKYAKSIGQNQWTGGEAIIPLSLESAQKWAEDHLGGDDYEKIFGDVEETSSKHIVTFSLSEATIEKIARKAAELGISKSEVIERMI